MTLNATSQILSVNELTQAIKNKLESGFSAISIKGEVSNLRKQASGHTYFTLKDAHAQISAVLFKGNARLASHQPKEGDQVVVKGEINVYPPRGSYQIIVREVEHAGLGALLLQLHQLKARLEKQGWFDPSIKKAIPAFPKTIGVVTSPTGAVIQDILNVLERRFPFFHLILNPVKVQGNGAAEEIAQAIDDFNRFGLADVLIVGRGGGSLEDLWPFNEEIVAAAIHRSKVPIISAVGHETDVTIADCVADVRAPTPSAAAEISVGELKAQMDFLADAKKRCAHYLLQSIRQNRAKLEGIKRHPFFTSSYALLAERSQKVDALDKQLQALNPALMIQRQRERLNSLTAHLAAINPKNLLKKGYCIPFAEKDHSVMMSAQSVRVGEKVRLHMHDGIVKSTVNEVDLKSDKPS